MDINLNRLARQLWPYLQPLVEPMLRRGGTTTGTTGGAVGGAPSPHALNSVHHTGTLGDGQAPQFLKTNGSRQLTGNLGVAAGVTIDGVDLSAHAANADAHHNRQHSVTSTADHTASGLTAGHVLRASAATTFAWAQLQHGDLGGVTANQHHNQVHGITGTDHTVTGDQYDVVGLSAANTLGLLASANDVGTSPALRLLRSTGSGGLTLGSLTVKGAATVDGDLTAAATGFRVINHTHDGAHAHVVINPGVSWSLDEQFGLDVDDNLLVRGWIVGKHAIQLDDCTMLLHFDGPERSLNLSGQTRGHLGQVPMLESGVTFAPGKFGMAVQTPVATTNLVTNPSFETGVTGWILYGNSIGTLSRVTTMAYAGNYAYQIAKTSGANTDPYGTYRVFSATSGITYTASAWVNIAAAVGGNRAFVLRVQGTGVVPTTTTTLTGVTDGWVRLSVTFTATGTGSAQLQMYWSNVTTGTAYIDAVQIEESSYATAYCDGTLGAGHSWSGTAHASTSSRTAATLDYNVTNALNAGAGTVAAWVRPVASGVGQMVFSTGTGFWLRATSGGAWDWTFANVAQAAAGAWTANTWHYVVLTWNGTNSYLYVNGALVATYAAGMQNAAMTQLSVGRYRPSSNQAWTGLIDEVMLRSVETTADQVRAIYESGAPVFAETSSWHWRAGRNRLWADAEGLWAYGAAGGSVLGLYFGDETNPALTKSWGNVDLSEGDMLLGTYGASNGGWMWFDQDLVGGVGQWKFGYADKTVLLLDSGGATLDGVLDISTTGGIYQGTGTFDAPGTGIGLKIWRESNVGRIAGYNNNANPEWYAGTDGKLYAGGGAVQMDRTGLTVNVGTSTTPPASERLLLRNVAGNKKVGELYGWYGSGIGAQNLYLDVPQEGGLYGELHLRAYNLSGVVREIAILAGSEQIDLIADYVRVAGSLYVDGDKGGSPGTVGFTDVTNTAANSSGVGTIKFKGTTSRDSTGFIKIYIGTTAYYVPVFAAITG